MLRALTLFAAAATLFTTASPAAVPPPRDLAYPGTIALAVDATDLDHRLFRVRETLPVRPGPLTLLYPKWLPGNHAPTGPIEALAGLIITAGGQRLEWRRDPVDVYAFHVDVPKGVAALELRFEYATATGASLGRYKITPDLLDLQWEKTLLYPAGYYASRINVQAEATLPPGWSYGCALEVAAADAGSVRFAPVTLERLVDSPLFAGRYARHVALAEGERPVRLHAFADRPALVDIQPAQLEIHRRLVGEAIAALGPPRYAHYDLLLAVSDNLSGIGLEHLQSSENGVTAGYFAEWDADAYERDLLAHEFTHSWNGKYWRPADLWTPNYNVPMRTSLLWVYEGMTEFWGDVLATRAGLWSEAFARDALAYDAATFQYARAGRRWRSLQDTTSQPVVQYAPYQSFPSWQRADDYYTEGVLLWLDVDTRLRELTGERRSLEDFCRALFRAPPGAYGPVLYRFDDVVAALESVAADDWRGFLRTRLDSHGPDAPLDGLARGGWKLVFDATPSAYLAGYERQEKRVHLGFSLGMQLSAESGQVLDVVWDSPAFQAGLSRGQQLIAVNGRAYSPDVLREAVRAAGESAAPIELLVRNYDLYRTLRIDYHGGLRYPHLARLDGQPDRLGALLKARVR